MSPLFDEQVSKFMSEGDEFLVTFGVSKDGVVWSEEHSFSFNYHDGDLYPLAD